MREPAACGDSVNGQRRLPQEGTRGREAVSGVWALQALYVTNDPGHVTTVSVADTLNLDYARLALDAGAVFDVATGGSLNYVSPAPH